MKLVKCSSLITIDQLHVQLLLSIAFDEEYTTEREIPHPSPIILELVL